MLRWRTTWLQNMVMQTVENCNTAEGRGHGMGEERGSCEEVRPEKRELGMPYLWAHTCNLRASEAEARELPQVLGHPGPM